MDLVVERKDSAEKRLLILKAFALQFCKESREDCKGGEAREEMEGFSSLLDFMIS